MAKPRSIITVSHAFKMDNNVTLDQRGPDDFRVTYGQQVEDHLNYADAAMKFGQAIMHSIACKGILDNRSKKESKA